MNHPAPLTTVVAELLDEQDMSGRELARRANITTATLNRRLRLGGWKVDEVERIAAAFDMKASELTARAERGAA